MWLLVTGQERQRSLCFTWTQSLTEGALGQQDCMQVASPFCAYSQKEMAGPALLDMLACFLPLTGTVAEFMFSRAQDGSFERQFFVQAQSPSKWQSCHSKGRWRLAAMACKTTGTCSLWWMDTWHWMTTRLVSLFPSFDDGLPFHLRPLSPAVFSSLFALLLPHLAVRNQLKGLLGPS